MKIELEKCPSCGSSRIIVCKIWSGKTRYFVECTDCHWCSNPKILLLFAKLRWNKLARLANSCYGCKHKNNDGCPNSALCYSLPFKPYYEEKVRIVKDGMHE